MLFRNCSLILIVYFTTLQACNSKTQKQPLLTFQNDTVSINKVLAEAKTDSAFGLANTICDKLLDLDSFNTYINLNKWLIKKFSSTEIYTKHFYKNIFSLENKIPAESNLLPDVAKAFQKWADISYNKEPDNDSTISCFENALRIDSKYGGLDSAAKRFTYKSLGIYYNKLGDLKKTLQYYQLRKQYVSPSNLKAKVADAINISIVLMEMNQPDSALSLLTQVKNFNDIPTTLKSNFWSTQAAAYFYTKDLTKAEEKVNLALALLDTIGNTNGEVNEKKGIAYKQKGALYLEKANSSFAIFNFKKALAAYQNIPDASKRDIAKIHIALADAYKQTHFSDSALWHYQYALRLVTKIPNKPDANPDENTVTAENAITESCDGKATVLLNLFNETGKSEYLIAAINAYQASFFAEQRLLETFSYDESRLNMLAKSKQRSEQAINACYNLYKITNEPKWLEKAFQFAENSKAIVLKESIRRNIATNKSWQKDSSWQKVQHYIQTVSYYEKQLAITPDSSGEKSAKLMAQLNAAEQNLLMAKNNLKLNEKYQKLFQKDERILFQDIKKKLISKNTSLLEYFCGDSVVYLFQLSNIKGLSVSRINKKIIQDVNTYLSFFSNKNKINNEPQAYEKAAYTLFQALNLDSIANDKQQNLIIIPDGMLSIVPFESLVTKITGSVSPKQFAYLLLDKQISYGFSAETLIRQAETHSATKGISCFAPVFPQGERGNTPLLNTEDELSSIKKEKTSGDYFLKEKASIANFKKNTDNNIIHIATHARSDTSGGMPVIEFYDSTLYLNEIYTLPMSASLVVLSACETGIGKIDKSEGAISLARGFYYAGAKNIITSLWSVDDKSTGTLFGNFYHSLSHDNYSSSLRKSKLSYLYNTSTTTASPYYWAGFIHIGHDADSHNGKRLPLWLIIAATGTLLLIGFGLLQRKK